MVSSTFRDKYIVMNIANRTPASQWDILMGSCPAHFEDLPLDKKKYTVNRKTTNVTQIIPNILIGQNIKSTVLCFFSPIYSIS